MLVRLIVFSLMFCVWGIAGEVPPLQHSKTYDEVSRDQPLVLADYWVSEKLDGVRAYWDGERLVSRQGNAIHAPQWFLDGLPDDVVLDGELWIGRGKFELVSGTVRRKVPEDKAWRSVRYCIFDLPKHAGTFDERVAAMRELDRELERGNESPWLQVVGQQRLENLPQLQQLFDQVIAAGGEGLMLHRGSARYQAKRTEDLLKYKPLDDAEAVVVAHLPGKGKYEGMLGALEVELPTGEQFKIGTGFTDAERRNPPAVGSTITFQYSGKTVNGVPRFARFLRKRVEF